MMFTAILPMLLDPVTDAGQFDGREARPANPDAFPFCLAWELWGCRGCVRRFWSCAAGEGRSEFERLLEVESC